MLTFFGWTVKDSRSLSFGTFEGWGISKASTFKGKNDDKMELVVVGVHTGLHSRSFFLVPVEWACILACVCKNHLEPGEIM